MATLDEVAAFVATACGLVVGTDLIKGKMPATPDVCASIHEYGGLAPDFVFGASGIAHEFPRLQLAFRGTQDDYETPRELAETAYQELAAASAQALSGVRYAAFTPLQPPFLLRREADGRVVIGFNVQVEKEPSL